MDNLISCAELKTKLDQKEPLIIIDVREDEERVHGHIQGDRHIPMGDLLHAHEDLDHGQLIVIYCRSGVRSFQACRLLERYGFARVKSLDGGIKAWAKAYDPSIIVY